MNIGKGRFTVRTVTGDNPAPVVLLAVPTPILVLACGQLSLGDYVFFTGNVIMVKGGLLGESSLFVVKDGGSGTVYWTHDWEQLELNNVFMQAGTTWRALMTGVGRVVAAGTFDVGLYGESLVSNSTVGANLASAMAWVVRGG